MGEIKVKKGDRFFIYSDGLIEKPEEKNVWTECLKDLLEACDRLRSIPILESAKRLTEMMHERKTRFEDDIVVLGIEV